MGIAKRPMLSITAGTAMGALLAGYFGMNLFAFSAGVFTQGLICAALRLDRAAYRFSGITLAVVMLIPHREPVAMVAVWVYVRAHGSVSVWLLPLLLLVPLIRMHLQYGIQLYRNLYPVSRVQYYVPAVTFYSAALIASWWKNVRGAVVWKGRRYPAKSQ